MKKSLFFSTAAVALLLTISLQKLAAQNVVSGSPYWSLDGNANASSTLSKLGTTNAINLRLFTNNVERVHINYSNGYVGIGTTAPAYKLHVANTANAIYGNTTGTTSVGVWGNSPYRGVYGAGATGVYGNSSTTTGYGVYGHGGYYGVYGTGTLRGVWGVTTNASGYGVFGQGSSTSPGKGVYGAGYYGVYGEGFEGVYAHSNGGGGDAVYALADGGGSDWAGNFTSTTSIGVRAYSYSTAHSYGVFSTGTTGIYGNGDTIGVYGNSVNSFGIGVYGQSYFGVYGLGTEAVYAHSNAPSGDAVSGIANGGGADFGGNFYSSTSYGIYAGTGVSGGIAGFFDGSIYTTGTYQGSDRKLKQNITDVSNAMDIIGKLQPKYYEYRQDGNFKQMNLPLGKHYGLIAQDLEQVLPGLVRETEFISKPIRPKSELGPVKINPDRTIQVEKINASSDVSEENKIEVTSFKAVNYVELIPIMVKAMQEQQQQIGVLKDENADLKDRLKRLEDIVSKNVLTGNGGYSLDASLDQNTPNPFNNTTSIRYHLPESAANAKVVITDATGRTMKTLSLTGRGNGEINLNSGTFAAGSYNYTLWVDGKQIDSKKMIVAK